MMKKLFFLLIAMVFAMGSSWAQTLNESFEGTTFPPENWRIENTQGSSTPWIRSTTYPKNGSANAFADYNAGGSTNYLITPKLSVTENNYQISFWARMDHLNSIYNQTFLKVLVSTTTSDAESFNTTALLNISPSFSGTNQITETYQQWTVDLTLYIGQDIYIAFLQTNNNGFGLCLDDVTGPDIFVSSCPKPTLLTATNITPTGADLGWTDATGSLWNIQYMLSSQTNWTNSTTISGVTSMPYSLSGINSTSASTYKFRVQRDCGSE